MSKYIDADKLKAGLERQKHDLKLSIQSQGDYGQSCLIVAYENILSLTTSLQQEQPEVDLEKELENFAKQYPMEDPGSYRNLITLARHFAKWGAIHLNAKKEK